MEVKDDKNLIRPSRLSLKNKYNKSIVLLKEHRLRSNEDLERQMFLILMKKMPHLLLGPFLLMVSVLMASKQNTVLLLLGGVVVFIGSLIFLFKAIWLFNWGLALLSIKKGDLKDFRIPKVLSEIENGKVYGGYFIVDKNGEHWKKIKGIASKFKDAKEINEVIQIWEESSKPVRSIDMKYLETAIINYGVIHSS